MTRSSVAYCKFFLAALALAGCAEVTTEIDPSLRNFAEPILNGQQDGDATAEQIQIVSPAQPAPYDVILRKKYDELRFGFDHNIESLSISRLAGRQSLLPQIEPGVQVATTGNADISVRVRQVIFDGGVYRAQFSFDDHEAVLRQVELLRQLNDEAAEDIATFLSYRQNTERAELFMSLSRLLEDLLELADARVQGGIGAASDASLFALRLFEIQADAEIARADAQADLTALDVDVTAARETDFTFSEAHLPLSVVEAIAEQAAAEGALRLAKARRNPQVALDSRTGLDPFTGLPSTNTNLNLDTQPIAWGGSVDVKRAEQDVLLADHMLERETRDAERETLRLRGRIDALGTQLEQTETLIEKARDRFDSFRDQFEAGTSQLTEAVGLVETLRAALDTRVALKFQILETQLQLAAQGGHLWTFGGIEG